MEVNLQIRQNIVNNDLDKSFHKILSLLELEKNRDSEIYNEAVLLSRRYVYLRDQERLDLIDQYFSVKERNRLINQLILLTNKIANNKKQAKILKKEHFTLKIIHFFRNVGIFLGIVKK